LIQAVQTFLEDSDKRTDWIPACAGMTRYCFAVVLVFFRVLPWFPWPLIGLFFYTENPFTNGLKDTSLYPDLQAHISSSQAHPFKTAYTDTIV